MSDAKMCLRDTIAPKSDQLNYDDVMSGPLTIRVTGLAAGSAEQPVIIKAVDAKTGAALRDFKPCKSMRRILIAAWGDKGKDWIGQTARLYGDGAVKFGGVEVGGIRISHVSGIHEPLKVKLTTTRSKRAEVVIMPMAQSTGQEALPI
jgi:hypothetical protein